MNERAREALVAAALNGTPQITGMARKGEARCAAGVLQDFIIENCRSISSSKQALQFVDMTEAEWDEMVRLNDSGLDFLTIARKLGTKDEPNA